MAANQVIGGSGLTSNPGLIDRERNDQLLQQALENAQREKEFQARYALEQQQMAAQAEARQQQMAMAQQENARQMAQQDYKNQRADRAFDYQAKSDTLGDALMREKMKADAEKESMAYLGEQRKAELENAFKMADLGLKEKEMGYKYSPLGVPFGKPSDYGAPEGVRVTAYDERGQPKGYENATTTLTKEQMGAAMNLQKEFNDITKEYRGAKNSLGTLEALGKSPSAQGDMAIIYSFMRSLDPTSTVREGEFALAQSAAGVPQRIIASYNQLVNGKRLSDEQRKDVIDTARNAFGAKEESYKEQFDRYSDMSKRWGINPADVVGSASPLQSALATQGSSRAKVIGWED